MENDKEEGDGMMMMMMMSILVSIEVTQRLDVVAACHSSQGYGTNSMLGELASLTIASGLCENL